MSIFILQQKNNETYYESDEIVFNTDDLFIKYDIVHNKLSGIYKIKRTVQYKKKYRYYFYKINDYRRGLDKNDLIFNNIRFKFNTSSILKINKSKFDQIIHLLDKKNFQQTSSDYLFFNVKKGHIEIDYIQNHPAPFNIKKIIQYNNKSIQIFNTFSEQLIKRIINFHNVKNELKEIQLRIKNLFFKKLNILDLFQERFISIKVDQPLSQIPYEILLLDNKNNFFISRLIEIDDLVKKSKYQYETSIKYIHPIYKKCSLNRKNEINAIKNKLKNINYAIYEKQFRMTEFIKLIENSYIIHFSGHSVYNAKRKEYGLKINDHDIFYLSDFNQCINLPHLIVFHSCFEYKHLERLYTGLKNLFQSGVKNVLLPISEIWEEETPFFPDFYLHLNNGMEIGKAFKLIIKNILNHKEYYPLLFRLYGNPMEKYFKKNR